ncbi:MAG TPA: MarR family transcriptional regulator, partial [Methanomicrobiales archaeon]|nr:MarR family transcriptional regulator [Methanomicrobiales archaeon]
FVGGLFLGKDHALIIRPPQGYTASLATPTPDSTRDGLTWYGLRSLGAGEPRVVFSRDSFPLTPALFGIGLAVLALGIYAVRRRFRRAPTVPAVEQVPAPVDPLAALELGDRILALLAGRGGSLFQSEIVEILGLPKSTVSEAINRLHDGGKIEKVRKGRENLIRIPKGDEGDGSADGPASR